ncbi:stress protein [Streptomyces viridochromogenes]|uniref:Stress protein n=1 Tax=Streptomyces viridochromogenes TaxID=1938 RepID=A0A0J8C7M4_STRVR|nr:CAP domain-containing protein [Streptomyces viridochromogenes]KMS73900.1 stress protein [Streptomyces viridochromogenes]KOG10972.1 stress protein [Streptomyces viridochromogenes]KOG26091.1 stress protein [Streptomyces viridochromogenes]
MSELVPGGNLPLPGGSVTVRVPGPFDVSALITDDSGKVRGDADFVFYNQPSAPGARLHGDTLTVDPPRLRSGATRITVVVSPADPGTPLGRLPAPALQVTDSGGRPIARFAPPRPRQETVLLLAEVYRRGGGWKLRALGQGYADGLAGLARDFGVDVIEDATPTPVQRTPTPSAPATPSVPGAPPMPTARPTMHTLSGVTTPHAPLPDRDGFLGLVNSARADAGSPPVTLDARLASAAQAHAAAMAAAGQLGVEGRDGVSVYQRVTAAGFTYVTVGEHLVSGPRTPAEFVAYCLRTDQPRRTLHDPAFTHAAVGYVSGGRSGDTYWTALWTRPLTPGDLSRTATEVVELTNRERARAGLRPLAVDTALAAAAQAYSSDMAARAFYSHTSPEGSQPWDRAAAAGSRMRTIGENIACGQRSPAEVVEGWMNSPGHRANILKRDFTHIGIGFAGGGPAGTYWTQLFGA